MSGLLNLATTLMLGEYVAQEEIARVESVAGFGPDSPVRVAVALGEAKERGGDCGAVCGGAVNPFERPWLDRNEFLTETT